MPHPCLACGACCAHFRVSFHWSEAEPSLGGPVPPELTERLDNHRVAMRGTWAQKPRCIALDANIGVYSRCTIHPQRPSPCREVQPSWESGEADSHCDKARAAHGLPLLTPADWRWRDNADNDDDHPDDNGNSPTTPNLPPIAA